MPLSRFLEEFAPLFQPDTYSEEDQYNLSPFFTNLDKSVYVPLIVAPELVGALCSRASRAPGDLRYIYLHEFIYPFIKPERDQKDTDEIWNEKVRYGKDLQSFISFLHEHPLTDLFSNPRARSFYIKWLAQYGDDSIAQMAGAHLGFWGLSQIAIKHIEDQRIGIAPIEKSTRYVNYSQKVHPALLQKGGAAGHYLYYTDPTLTDYGLKEKYERVMDNLFETYARLIPKLTEWLTKRFSQEKTSVIEKKTFDTLRGLLPSSTLSQVAFFGNGQAFEYMVTRSLKHSLGEIRWAGERAYQEMFQVTPSFLRRIKDETRKEAIEEYQRYIAEKGKRMQSFVQTLGNTITPASKPEVTLVESDPEGEIKIIAGMFYNSSVNHRTWQEIFNGVKTMGRGERRRIIHAYLDGRKERWQRPGRAFENVYNRFEITMNIGAWRDLHRHRMLTQQRQNFSCYHGYDVPPELVESGLDGEFRGALDPVGDLYGKIVRHDPDLAQYATTLSHRIRFMQWENLRQSFWQIELRTIPEGHPDYRHIEQEKFRLLEKVYPLIAEHIRVNMGEYDFAR
ncbi:MAG: thymidylate synthase complementing protein ThyX, partial [Parcubacteria group bacterium Gr01-1014_33]